MNCLKVIGLRFWAVLVCLEELPPTLFPQDTDKQEELTPGGVMTLRIISPDKTLSPVLLW